MSGPDPARAGPGDYAEVALGELVARYVALPLGEDLDPGGGPVPAQDHRAGRALAQLALDAAIAGRVQAGWALEAVAALRAGASREQVAAAPGQDRLHRDTGLGLDPAEAAQAWRLLGPSRPAGPAGTGAAATARDLDGAGL